MAFLQFWRPWWRTASSIPTQHQTSLKPPINIQTDDNITTSHSSIIHVLIRKLIENIIYQKLCFYICAVSIWGIAVVSFPLVLPLLLLSLPLIQLLQFLTHGNAYDYVVEVKFFIRNFTYYYLVFFRALLYTLPSESHTSVKFLNVSLELWRKNYGLILFMFGCCYYSSGIFKYLVPEFTLDHTESGLVVREALQEIVEFVAIFYLIVEDCRKATNYPSFKTHEILGLHTWKWIESLIFIVVIHNIITLFIYLIVWLLRKFVEAKGFITNPPWYVKLLDKFLPMKVLVYWANGLKRSINFVLTSVVILLTWVLYIAPHIEETSKAKEVGEFGTWTCLSLLVSAFLWLMKNCVLLSWEARSVYNRLGSKILHGGKQLYFLGLIGRYNYDIFNLLTDHSISRQKYEDYLWMLSPINQSDSYRQAKLRKELSKRRMCSAKDYLLMQESQKRTIYGVRQAALHFLAARDDLLKESYTSNIIKGFQAHGDVNRVTKRINNNFVDIKLLDIINVDSYNDFKRHLRAEGYNDYSGLLPFERFENWMERAHHNCVLLADTLSNGKEVTDCLDRILSWLLIVASFIMWLRLTGLATTHQLLLIASLLMITTITLQGACKTLIKGIMFVYVMHPFDIGDLCVIEEQMMEVKTTCIWKTTFKTIDTQEEVIYSNSYLFNKKIVNFKTGYDWSASIELEASSLDVQNTKDLKQKIEEYLNNEDNFTPNYNNHVEVVMIGDNIKLLVKFRLNAKNLNCSTYSECYKEKCKQQSEFVHYVQSLLDQIKMEGSNLSEKNNDNSQENKKSASSSIGVKIDAAAKYKSKVHSNEGKA